MSHVATRNLTTLDFFKALAVIFMVIDHVGFILFPQMDHSFFDTPEMWFRAIGRLCVPIWFFLAGYSRSRRTDFQIMIGALVLLFANISMGLYVFPLNVLFSMLIVRHLIPYVARHGNRDAESMLLNLVILAFLYISTRDYFEYGLLGLAIAWFGYNVRLARDAAVPIDTRTKLLGLVVMVMTPLVQIVEFPFGFWQTVFVFVGMFILFPALSGTRFREYPEMTRRLGMWLVVPIQILGRRTMEIYVIHIIILRAIAWSYGGRPAIYGWFEWEWWAADTYRVLLTHVGGAAL